MPGRTTGDHGGLSLAGLRSERSPSDLGDDVIVMALGFPAALALFLLFMGWLERALFPERGAQTRFANRPEAASGPVLPEARP